ncbi:hypothetical protein P7K49_026419, partial [Saguinus oedipus]
PLVVPVSLDWINLLVSCQEIFGKDFFALQALVGHRTTIAIIPIKSQAEIDHHIPLAPNQVETQKELESTEGRADS